MAASTLHPEPDPVDGPGEARGGESVELSDDEGEIGCLQGCRKKSPSPVIDNIRGEEVTSPASMSETEIPGQFVSLLREKETGVGSVGDRGGRSGMV